MTVVAFDTETCLIEPGRQAPPLVCVTWQRPEGDPEIIHVEDHSAHALVLAWLKNEDVIVGHNVAYDMSVVAARWPDLVPYIFAAYEQDRVTDTMIRQQLLDIAADKHRGEFDPEGKWKKYGYSLDDLIYRVRGSRLKKDGWRLMYSYFKDTPLKGWTERAKEVQTIAKGWLETAYKGSDGKMHGYWPELIDYKDVKAVTEDVPEGAVTYPLEDARATLEVYLNQEQHAAYLKDQFRQARAALALHLGSVHGLKTTPQGVEQFEKAITEEFQDVKARLVSAGLVRADGTRDMKAAAAAMTDACTRLNQQVPKTDKGNVSLEKDVCDSVDDPIIKDYSNFLTLSKILNNDVENLRKGTHLPIHPRYGLADTGRTTCTGFNIQNVRRKAGVRELFVPRPGKVFAQADYEGLELHTFAQCCMHLFGRSRMAEALNAGTDPHLMLAQRILGCSYEEAKARYKAGDQIAIDARQTGKVCNFGYIGGLGKATLKEQARKIYGLDLELDFCAWLKEEWLALWDVQEFFNYIRDLCKFEGANGKPVGQMVHPYVDRHKVGTFTGLCSSHIQGLGADCAKNALWLVAKAQYTDRASPLFGARTVAFIHDEIICEVPDDSRAHDAAQELGRLMLEGANKYLKDCPARIEPLLMDHWSKAAKPIYDENKRLMVWRLKEQTT